MNRTAPMDRIRSVHPAVNFLVAFFEGRIEHARSEERDRGASAVEWVVISAIVVGIVLGVAFFIATALDEKATEVGNCIKGADKAGGDC